MKVSLITACYNSATTIRTAMQSVLNQKGVDIEYIVVDGASKDGTVDVIRDFVQRLSSQPQTHSLAFKWISEPDRGMYDAINKGINMATGDVVGILNADDVLAEDETLARIAAAFKEGVDCVYADIRFVASGGTLEALRSAKTVRYCSAAKWNPWMFRFAAMVPHPSFYVRRECFDRLGGYSLDYRICADFEL